MGDSELSEPMEDSHNDGDEKIDMSLDEIIKRNKKEQKESRATDRARSRRFTNRNNVLRKLNQTPQLRRGLTRGNIRYQGSNGLRGLGRGRGRGRGRGLSPLKRQSSGTTNEEELVQSPMPVRGSYRGRGRGRGGITRGAFSARGQRSLQRGGGPFVLDRGFAAMRGSGKLEQYQKIQSRRPASTSGTTLTVSLPNAQSPPATQVRPRRGGPVLRGRSSEAVSSRTEPKGINLHFNYRATTNQTQLSLNERFTSLHLRGQGLRVDREGSRGRGRGRGLIRGGRGLIRGGRGQIRGGRGGRGQIRGGRGGALRGARGGMPMSRGTRARGRGRLGEEGRTVFLQ